MESMTTESNHAAGELLKQGRLRQRLSIAECAKRTHIAPRYVEALEEERWSILPSESHRLGFLRLYARFLGVSADDVMNLYRQSTNPSTANKSGSPEGTSAKPEPPARVRTAPRTSGWSPNSGPQLIGFSILFLV